MFKKGFIIILIIIVLGIAGLWFLNLQTQKAKGCSNIISMLDIEKCLGKEIKTIGILECRKPDVAPKLGVHYLKFQDGSELRTFETIPDCADYNGKEVEIIGEFYQCQFLDQCAGTGLHNIESIKLSF